MSNNFLGLCTTQWQALSSIFTLLAVIAALFIAVFQDKMRAWIHRPILNVSIEMKPPYCLKTIISNSSTNAACYYFRIKVENEGNTKADAVEVLATELKIKKNDNYEHYKFFLPMNLFWSHVRKERYESIASKTFKFCDLGHITDIAKRQQFIGEHFNVMSEELFFGHTLEEETIFCFDTIVQTTTSNHLIPAGEYQLTILVAAENCKPIKKVLKIKIAGTWDNNEDNMLSEGVNICVLS